MTKKWHKCEKCDQGTFGVYVKVCKATGLPIEDYKIQLERQAKGLLDSRNFVKPDGKRQ